MGNKKYQAVLSKNQGVPSIFHLNNCTVTINGNSELTEQIQEQLNPEEPEGMEETGKTEIHLEKEKEDSETEVTEIFVKDLDYLEKFRSRFGDELLYSNSQVAKTLLISTKEFLKFIDDQSNIIYKVHDSKKRFLRHRCLNHGLAKIVEGNLIRWTVTGKDELIWQYNFKLKAELESYKRKLQQKEEGRRH